MFRLHDPTTKQLASNACASVRLGIDGRVAEISGLNDGQALEDSLVPIVEEKVRTLPGGDKFLAAFADKRQLIAMDRKFQSGEPFTDDELRFIFEADRKIVKLDTYNTRDPRIGELRDIEVLLKNGTDANSILSVISDRATAANLEVLLANGANVDDAIKKMGERIGTRGTVRALLDHGLDANGIIRHMYGKDIFYSSGEYKSAFLDDGAEKTRPVKNFELLMNAGGDVELVVDKLGWQQIFSHFGELTRYGADIDINEVASHLSPLKRLDELDTLVEYGAVIDIDKIVDELDTVQDENVEKLLSNGADAEAVAKKIAPSSMTVENYGLLASSVEDPMGIVDLVNAKNSNELDDLFGLLLDLDVSPDTLMSSDKFPDDTVERYVNDILANGGDVVALAERISPRAVLDNLDLLIEHDTPIDVGKIIDANTGDRLVSRVDWLLDNGADVSELVAKLSSEGIDETFDTLLKHGADINDLVRGLDEDATCKRFGMLMALGADIDLILQNLSEDTARQHAGELLGQGVNIDSILQRIPNIDISEIQSVHDGLGASYASLVPKLSDKDGKKGIDVLLEHSDEVDFQSIVSGLDPNTVLDNFRRIQEKGVTLSLEEIVSKSSGPAILKNIDMIKEAGITIDINKIVSNLHPSLVFDHIETLLDNGADPRLVLERYPEKVLFFMRPDPKILKSKSAALRRAREAAGSAT